MMLGVNISHVVGFESYKVDDLKLLIWKYIVKFQYNMGKIKTNHELLKFTIQK